MCIVQCEFGKSVLPIFISAQSHAYQRMLSDITETSSADDSEDDDEFHPKKKKKLKTRKRDDRQKQATSTINEQPSVYSSSEIRRHEKRLKRLKALEQGGRSESDTESEDENVDPDLDINFRIFESSAASVDNMIIGEIQCNVKADDKITANDVNEKANKNSSIFKVSVNANFDENSGKVTDKNGETDEELSDDIEREVDDILSMGSCNEFTEDDSDLEILMSKPLVRRRAAVPPKRRDKPTEGSKGGKLTMYDLIYDTVTPRRKNESSDEDDPEEGNVESKTKKKKKKTTNTSEKVEIRDEACNEEIIDRLETTESSPKVHLGVPQLKVTDDGQVVVDVDSLTCEETGLSEARNKIANSELIEECGLTHTSYAKKRNFPKQWSPQDTLKFYDVLSTIGTDFSLMATLFPGRTRTCMKRKFKREEKIHGDLILKALSCRQTFDLGLLEKELRIKEERVNQIRENSKAQKVAKNSKTNKQDKQKISKNSKKPKRLTIQEQGLTSSTAEPLSQS